MNGITVFPFIFIQKNLRDTTEVNTIINHETIHIQQQLETLIIPFYIHYILNFLFNILTKKSEPYRNLQAEKEAYKNEKNLDYLKTRKRYSWLFNKQK